MLSRIIKQNGNRVFEIDGKIYLPAAFRSFRPTPANISLFYRRGVRLFQMQCSGLNSTLGIPYSNFGGAWVGDHKYDFSALDRQIKMFQRFAPEGYFMLMVQLDMPGWWIKENNVQYDSYVQLGEAVLEEKWIKDACDYLQAFIRYAEDTYGDRVFAYSFSAGCATEWFDGWYDKISDRKIRHYKETVGNANVPIPTKDEIRSSEPPLLRDPADPVYQYQKYCQALTPNLILRFADAAQQVLNHKKIVGLFFGYTDQPVNWQNQTATNGYETVWESNDIDMLFSPAAYQTRGLGQVSSYQYQVDSISVHDKLYLHEIDHRTHLSGYPFDSFAHGLNSIYKDADEDIRVLRRELCAAAVKDGALWWFDFTGGYYACPELETEIQKEMDVLETLYSRAHKSVSEIAVFVDPLSFLHMKDNTTVTNDCVSHNRDALHNSGAPYDYFNFNDITKIDLSQYKMCVFLNTISIPNELKQFIRHNLCDITKVWLWAPDWASGGMDAVISMCDIHLREIHAPNAKIRYKDEVFGFGSPTAPLYAPDDSEAYILAYYENGMPACAQKGKNVYLAAGNVPAVLWQDLARAAGVHIYADTPGALYVDSRFVARQSIWETELIIHMPFDCVVEELFDGGYYRTENKELRYHADEGAMKLFMIREVLQ